MFKKIRSFFNNITFEKLERFTRRKAVTVLAAVVVFCTTYALILPAITWEKTLICEKEEHVHTETCYQTSDDGTSVLICEKEDHTHTDACFDAPLPDEATYYCNKTEHIHDENCYFEDGTLNCTLTEHIHDISCVERPEPMDPEIQVADADPEEDPETDPTVEQDPAENPETDPVTEQDPAEDSETDPTTETPEAQDSETNPETDSKTQVAENEQGRRPAVTPVVPSEDIDPSIGQPGVQRPISDDQPGVQRPVSDDQPGTDEDPSQNPTDIIVEKVPVDDPKIIEIKQPKYIKTISFDRIRLGAAELMGGQTTITVDTSVNLTMNKDDQGNWTVTLVLNVENPTNDVTYLPEYSNTRDGENNPIWQNDTTNHPAVKFNSKKMTAPLSFDISDWIASATIEESFRITATKDNKNYYSAPLNLMALLDEQKSGFSSWVANSYVSDFGGDHLPENTQELLDAFELYQTLPSLTLTSRQDGNTLYIDASTDYTGTPSYVWEYLDEASGNWVAFTDPTPFGASLNTTDYAFLNEGRDVRCKLYNAANNELLAIAKMDNVNPRRKILDDAIAAINADTTVLNLAAYPVNVGTDAEDIIYPDLRIHGDRYDNYFYWTNLANDSRVPFTDGASFADYLAEAYLAKNGGTAGMEAVKEIWQRYIFDMYDPVKDSGMIETFGSYPTYNYGDQEPGFIKDKNSSSFHATQNTPLTEESIVPLNYNFLENGVDYENFVTGLNKTATAVAAGDANSERKYLIDITADAQSKVSAPVCLIFQIQTSWQMFDLLHANIRSKDSIGTTFIDEYGDPHSTAYVAVGAVADNTAMANLYDIKQALLGLVDYMEKNYKANNLVLGITETRHDASQTMFLGKMDVQKTNNKGQIVTEPVDMYVTNDYDTLREGIINWDSFGNCEHVHYTSTHLENALDCLEDNLSLWHDVYSNIDYDDIQKVAVIIGGPTELKAETNGYACTLPWGTFLDNHINSVYGIRVNEGTSYVTSGTEAGILSWIDYSKNNDSSLQPYSYDPTTGVSTGVSGTGDKAVGRFTKKYVASSEHALLDTLIEIVEKEMKTKGIKVNGKSAFIENLTVNDTVENEFKIDNTVPFTATVKDENGKVVYETIIDIRTGAVVQKHYDTDGNLLGTVNITGTRNVNTDADGNLVTTVTFNESSTFTDGPTFTDVPKTLTVTENTGTHTTDVEYNFGSVVNTQKVNLNFGVVAREDYLGSNNVFTNVGTPEASYMHTPKDEGGNPLTPKTYPGIDCTDTPQVNVPVVYDTVDGLSKTVTVGTNVDLEDDLDKSADGQQSRVISAAIEDLLDNYDQTNGTLTYTWVKPDGTVVQSCGSVTVVNGVLQGDLPDLTCNYEAEEGEHEFRLQLTFTPNTFVNSENFKQDGVTNVAVDPKTEHGKVWVKGVEPDSSLKFYLRKTWTETPPEDITSVDVVISDGKGGYVGTTKDSRDLWNIVEDKADAQHFTISAADGWQTNIVDSLPAIKVDDQGNAIVLDYRLEETAIDGYEARYSKTTQTDKLWQDHPDLTLRPTKISGNNNDGIVKNNAKWMNLVFKYHGTTYTYSADMNQHPSDKNHIDYGTAIPLNLSSDIALGSSYTLHLSDIHLPLDANGQPFDNGAIEIVSLTIYKSLQFEAGKGGNPGSVKYENPFPPADGSKSLATSTASVHFVSEVENPVLVVNNTPADHPIFGPELPATGGIGTAIFYVSGGTMLLGAAIAAIILKRKNKLN